MSTSGKSFWVLLLSVSVCSAGSAATSERHASVFGNVISTVSNTPATIDDAQPGAASALERASHKLAAAVQITDRFSAQAQTVGLDPSWRFGMIANMMRGDESMFAAVAYAVDIDHARLAAQDVATMHPAKIARPSGDVVPRTASTGSGSSGFGNVSTDLVFVPVPPCRILDTRAGLILPGHTASDFYFDAGNVGASTCSVSVYNNSGAFPAAIAINATVVASAFSGPSAYLAIYPQGSAKSSSFLNYTPGETIANAGLIAINQASGEFTVFNQESTHLIVDVFGIFTRPGALTSATGAYSTALGQGTTASGDNSVALGYYSSALGSDSFAMGHESGAAAAAPFSAAVGYRSYTGAPAAMAFGNNVQATADSSVALGYYTVASAQRATAMGDATVASGVSGATAMGSGTKASGAASTAMGSSTVASNSYATAMGASTQAQGASSTAMGQQTIASGDYSTAMGYSTTANGYIATATGYANTASGNSSFVIGQNNTAAATASFAAGQGNTVYGNGVGSVVMGVRAFSSEPYSFVFNSKTDTTYGGAAGSSFSVSVPDQSAITFVQAGQFCFMSSNHAGWSCESDRNAKTSFESVDERAILAKVVGMPVSTWEWKQSSAKGMRHLGPMAQDFKAAFSLGGKHEDTSIDSTDAQGVAFAAIKGLYSELRERDAKLAELTAEIAALRGAVRDVESRRTGVAHVGNAFDDEIARNLAAPPM